MGQSTKGRPSLQVQPQIQWRGCRACKTLRGQHFLRTQLLIRKSRVGCVGCTWAPGIFGLWTEVHQIFNVQRWRSYGWSFCFSDFRLSTICFVVICSQTQKLSQIVHNFWHFCLSTFCSSATFFWRPSSSFGICVSKHGAISSACKNLRGQHP